MSAGAADVAPSGVGRGLTPEVHSRIRRHLALIPVYVWLVDSWKDLLLRLPTGLPGANVQFARDFIQFYLQGLLANRGDARALYDIDRWAALVPALVPTAPQLRYPPIYGPQVSVLFSPLARLSYTHAMFTWIALSVVIYLACGYAIWRTCPRLRDRAGMVAVLLLADPALHYALGFAQISALGLLCVTGAWLALRANRPLVAGLAIGSLIYKPQLGLAAAFVFVFAREWRVVAGAILGAAAQLAVGCLFWGPSILIDYVRSLVRLAPVMREQFEPFRFHMHSWRSFLEQTGLPPSVAMGGYLVVAAIILVVALQSWRARGPLPVRFAVLLVATVLVNPHLYVYDYVILAPAFLLLWDWAEEQRGRTVGEMLPGAPFNGLRAQSFTSSFAWLLYFCYMAPLLAIVAYMTRVQLSVPALTVLGLVPAAILLSKRGIAPTGGIPASA